MQGGAAIMSSGSETRRRKNLLRVRCTDEELAAMKAAVASSGFASVGEFVRGRLLGRQPPRRSKIELHELCRCLGLIGHYGSNVNQMARVANASGDLPAAARLEELRRELREIRDSLMRAIGKRGR
jgi:hypothetical protein